MSQCSETKEPTSVESASARQPTPPKAKISHRTLWIIGAIVGIVLVVVIVVLAVVFAIPKASGDQNTEKVGLQMTFSSKKISVTTSATNNIHQSSEHTWRGCQNLGKCQLKGLDKPPLVLLSLDGFRKDYLSRKLLPSLDHFGECGARGLKVFPSYPSKTFPNHYTIVTGLYPESHGIVDNKALDKKISPKLESMSRANSFYMGDPIWSVYKRLTGKLANSYFWPGSSSNSSGYPPSISMPYRESVPFRERMDTVVEWLLSPPEKRPGLVALYLHEPDFAGHFQSSPENINTMLRKLDGDLDYFLTKLNDANLLECINLAILSDHGMQLINKTYYMDDYTSNFTGSVINNGGVIGRVYVNNANASKTDLADQLQCKFQDIKVNTRADIPIRQHYSRTDRIGDFIMKGPPGSRFLVNHDVSDFITADHGYDYLYENMQTLFFIRGPSIKPNVTVPPFQNVQYMNLWMNLLGVEGGTETNGTVGFFDNILVKPPKREMMKNRIKECPVIDDKTTVVSCVPSDAKKLEEITKKLKSWPAPSAGPILYSDEHCYQQYAETVIIKKIDEISSQKNKRVAVVEALSKNDIATDQNPTYVSSRYRNKCSHFSTKFSSISAGLNTEMNRIADTFFGFSPSYEQKVLLTLKDKTSEYLKKYGNLFVISGTATDTNYDGIADSVSEEPNLVTHVYRVFITCASGWVSTNPPACKGGFDEFRTLSFIFPILNKSAMDCMTPEEIMLDYTATIFDVEQIAGFKFQLDSLTHQENVVLRRQINTQL